MVFSSPGTEALTQESASVGYAGVIHNCGFYTWLDVIEYRYLN